MATDSFRLAMADVALDMFPPLIKDALISDEKFRQCYGISTTARVSIGKDQPTYRREKLFSGIRNALEKPTTPIFVEDDNNCFWLVKIEEIGGERHTILELEKRIIRLPDFWAFAPDKEVRIGGFKREAAAVNLCDEAVDRWLSILDTGPIKDEAYELLIEELKLTPTSTEKRITGCIAAGSCSLLTLVPDDQRYFQRLVGRFPAGADFSTYVDSEVNAHVTQLMNWSQVDGLKLSLLLSSHLSLTQAIAARTPNARDLEFVFSWVCEHGDLLSKLGAIEIGLSLLDRNPALEPILERMVEDISADNPNDEGSRFFLVSSLVICVSSELARTQVLRGNPPFWIRLAAIAQASLIERIVIAQKLERRAFAIWARDNREQNFFFQTLVDLRTEPRWMPEFASPQQLKAEFLGRIASAASNNQQKLHSPRLRQLLLEESPGGIRELMGFPFPFLPGPLEGAQGSNIELPQEAIREFENNLASEDIHPNSFALLVNSAFIFNIGQSHAQIAAAALRNVRYQLHKSEHDADMFQLISGLANVAAITRSKELASELRILCRVTRRYDPEVMTIDREFRIALIAAASNSDIDNWAALLGDWVAELAFVVKEPQDARNLLMYLRCLFHLEPKLEVTCAKADAALSSVAH